MSSTHRDRRLECETRQHRRKMTYSFKRLLKELPKINLATTTRVLAADSHAKLKNSKQLYNTKIEYHKTRDKIMMNLPIWVDITQNQHVDDSDKSPLIYLIY